MTHSRKIAFLLAAILAASLTSAQLLCDLAPTVETAMKVKYSEDERDAQMYDILQSTVVFDFGRVFNDSLGSKTYSMFRSSIMNNNTNWASTWEGNKDSLISMLADVVAAFEK